MVDLKWENYSLTPGQMKVADYIKKHLQLVMLSTEQEIASEIGVSIATVSRFWKVVGYQNMKDFKRHTKEILESSPSGKMKSAIRIADRLKEPPYLSLTACIHLLQQTLSHIDFRDFERSIHLIRDARKVYILAQGPSEGLGRLFAYRLARFGIDIIIIEKYGTELFEEILHIHQSDVIILFAFGRLLPEAKVILHQQKYAYFRTIMITDQLVAEFTKMASITLFASRGEQNDFHSMIAPTFLIENIIISLGITNQEENIQHLERLAQLRKKYAAILPR